MIFEEILNLKVDQASTRELVSISNQYMKATCDKLNGISSVTKTTVGKMYRHREGKPLIQCQDRLPDDPMR